MITRDSHNQVLLLTADSSENLSWVHNMDEKGMALVILNYAEQVYDAVKNDEFKVAVIDHKDGVIDAVSVCARLNEYVPGIIRIILSDKDSYTELLKKVSDDASLNVLRLALKPVNQDDMIYALKQAVKYYDVYRENVRLIHELTSANLKLGELTFTLDQKVKERTAQLESANKLLEELALTDPLTGIGNRRYFNERIRDEMARMKRRNSELSVIMVDIDFFKRYNDEHGHEIGDKILRDSAKVIKNSLRGADTVARYGGEEFVVILPETSKYEALQISERLRKNIERDNEGITISLGVASYPHDAVLDGDLIKRADNALYRAKTAGRNQVAV